MTEMELLIDFHKDADRQGPGSTANTLKALCFVDLPREKPLRVADIGCGSGAQTIALAQNIAGHITAVDLFPEFLTQLNRKANELGLQDKITTLEKSMDDLSFGKEEFDIMGFEAGIRQWKHFLKPGGYLAVSEITWLTNTRPEEIEAHWNTEYPEIDTASRKIKLLEEHGFSPVGYFSLPQESWLDTYYRPMEERLDTFLERHDYSEAAKALVEADKDKIEKYKRFKDYFSYGFYVAKN